MSLLAPFSNMILLRREEAFSKKKKAHNFEKLCRDSYVNELFYTSLPVFTLLKDKIPDVETLYDLEVNFE